MRFFYALFAFLLLPLIGFGQFEFKPGTYELANGTKGEGELKYNSGFRPRLTVKTNKNKTDYSPGEVNHFTMGEQLFMPVSDFILDSGLPFTLKSHIENDFAELVDTGRVQLLYFYFLAENSVAGTRSPTVEPKRMSSIVLIRQRGGKLQSVPVLIKKTRSVIAPFLTGRPDLVARLNSSAFEARESRLSELRSIIQAYNSGKN